MTANALLRAAVYARISKEEAGAEWDKPDVQVQRMRKLADKHGYEISEAHVFKEAPMSAFQERKRPEFEALQDAIESKEIDVVLAYAPERLARLAHVSAPFYWLCRESGVLVHTETKGLWDLSKHSDRAQANQAGNFAEEESGVKSERVLAKFEEKTALGEPKGGPRPFGYESDGMTLRVEPDGSTLEADLIKQAYEDVLDNNVSQFAIAQRWNEMGVTTARGNLWHQAAVRVVLARPANAGILVVKGVVQPESKITPIVDEDTLNRFLALGKTRKVYRGPKAKTLLANILLCQSGHQMVARPGKGHVPIYVCKTLKTPGTKEPGPHGTIRQHLANKQAIRGLFYALAAMDYEDPAPSVLAPLEAQWAALLEERTRLSTLLTIPGLDTTPIIAKINSMIPIIEKAEAAYNRAVADDAAAPLAAAKKLILDWKVTVPGVDPADIPMSRQIDAEQKFEEAFSALPFEQQRAIFQGTVTVQLMKPEETEKASPALALDWKPLPLVKTKPEVTRIKVTPKA